MPAMCMRFWPGWSWLKKIVAEKTYGEVRAASFRRVSANARVGQGGHRTPAARCLICTFTTRIS